MVIQTNNQIKHTEKAPSDLRQTELFCNIRNLTH
nr:MAG TPA: hypothetical protein [Caudoviricetes sp.]